MIRCLTILLCCLAGVAAQEAKLPAEQYHFLFVIDTSISMAPRKPVAIQMMRELITSGFVGQARNGDSVDIWLYDQENDISRFPPQIWEQSESKKIADTAARFVEQLQFQGRSRFEAVARDLDALLPNTKKLLVVILTDGEEPLSGVSPDIEINEYVGKLKHAIIPKHPFVISMAAIHGRFERWAVYNGDGKDDLAALPSRARPKSLVAKAAPKSPEKKTETKTEKEQRPEDRRPEPQPIIFELPPGARLAAPAPATPLIKTQTPLASISQKALARPELSTVVSTTRAAASNSPRAFTNNLAQRPAPAATVPATTTAPAPSNAPPILPTPASPAVAKTDPAPAPFHVAQSSQPLTNSIKVAASSNLVTVAATKEIPTNVVAAIVKPPEEPKAPPPTLAATSIPTGAILGALAFAGFAIMGAGAFLFLKKAKARHDGSIISQSLLR